VRVAILNGPNLGRLGTREPEVYGRETLSAIMARARDHGVRRGVQVEWYQSNHEGALIDYLEERAGELDGVVLNPGALTHYGISLRDAVAALSCPVIEVHLSNVHRREEFRRTSVLSPVTVGQIVGFGGEGYVLAIDALVALAEEASGEGDLKEGGHET
jgi:3-dehydroquinate dehydratase-2